MAYALSDLISEAQNKIGDASFSQADLINYANNTNRDIHTKHKLSYMEAVQTYTTSAVALLGTLPTDFLRANNIRLTDIQYAQKLPWWTADRFDENYPQPSLTSPSTPLLVYEYARSIYLYPTPNVPTPLSGYAIALRYWKKPTKLTATTDVPDVPEEFKELLLLGMLRQSFERRQRYDVSQLIDNQYQDKLVDLLDIYASGTMQEADPYVQE